MQISDSIPLIGFAGAPFTLASYVIEGGASRNYLHTKALMYRDEGAWRELMQRLVRSITVYLNAQIRCGVQCVQLFDSWVGCLGPSDYRRFVLPFVKNVIDGLDPDVPVINFATGNPALLPLLAEASAPVVGIDWRVNLDAAWQTVGHQRAVQGNLDPAALLAGGDEIRRRAKQILDQAGGRPGHIFNLGHGVLPQTPVASARTLVDLVHELSQRL
jgi:uroporphyrinogen decarboxylase